MPNQRKFTINLEGTENKYEDATETGGLDIGITFINNQDDVKLLNSYKPINLKDDEDIRSKGESILLFSGYRISGSKFFRDYAKVNRTAVHASEVSPNEYSGKVIEGGALDPTRHIVGHLSKDKIIIQKDEGETQGRFYPQFQGLSGGSVFRAYLDSDVTGFVGIGVMADMPPTLDKNCTRYLVALRAQAIIEYIERWY